MSLRPLALVAVALVVGVSANAQEPPAKPAPAPVRYELDGHRLVVPTPFEFETGSDKLRPSSTAAVQYVAGYLRDKPYITLLRVEQHADDTGPAKDNQPSTERRALAIARALVAAGTDCKRLIPVGFGGSKPIAPNDTPDNRARNRRTEMHNAALKGRPIGGMPVDGGGRVAGDPCAR